MDSATGSPHVWQFFRTGGLDQVALTTGADLLALRDLDKKLWVALSCPVKGLELDEKTLALIDTDGDGRIRVPELLATIEWAAARLIDPGVLLRGEDGLPLADFNQATPEGKLLFASAKHILASHGQKDGTALTVAQAADTAKIFASSPFNGDGVVTAQSASDAAVQELIKDVIATVGGTPDKSGATGVTAAQVEKFLAEATAYVNWTEQGIAGFPGFGATRSAVEAVQAVRAKVEDYFTRCRLAAFDPKSTAALNPTEANFAALAAKDIKLAATEAAGFPLARIEAGRALPLFEGVNPAWAGALATLHAAAITPVLGAATTTLTEPQWQAITAKLAEFEAWMGGKPGGSIEKLGYDRLKESIRGYAGFVALHALEMAVEPEFRALGDVERLVRFHRDLRTLLHNFVNFADFYSRDRWATFQAGTLYLDSRSTEFCFRVEGPHPLAAMSKTYIAYCTCTRPGSPPMTIAACLTQGDSDYVFAGRHGLFYDRAGRDWDAVVTSIVDNPISLRQAFWSPYKKFVRMIDEMAAKRAATADAAANDRMSKVADKVVTAAAEAAVKPPAAPPPPPPEPKKFDVGVIAAMGVAVGAIGGALAGVAATLGRLEWWQFPLVVIGLMLAISTPAVIIAFIKLRQRTLGPILDANGWAINGRVKINIPFGTALTDMAVLPPGAQRSLDDPYEDKEAAKVRKRWTVLIVLFVIAALAMLIRIKREETGHYFWQPAPKADKPAAPEAKK